MNNVSAKICRLTIGYRRIPTLLQFIALRFMSMVRLALFRRSLVTGVIGPTKLRLLVFVFAGILFLLPAHPVQSQSCGSEVDNFVSTEDSAAICPTGHSAQTDPGSTVNQDVPVSMVGNPVSIITGNKYQLETDFGLPGSHLQLNRHYNSNNTDYNVGVGHGWHTSYDVRLSKLSSTVIEIIQSNGRRISFNRIEFGTESIAYVAVNPGDGIIEESEKQRTWKIPDGRQLIFRGPFLNRVQYADTRFLSLYYRFGKLHEVSDETGRTLVFQYRAGKPGLTRFEADDDNSIPAGHLESVTLPDGQQLRFGYDQHHNLVTVTYQDGTHTRYHYEDSDFKNLLTGVTNRLGERTVSWRYNQRGRANAVLNGDGSTLLTLQVDEPDDNGLGKSVVTNSIGQKTIYQWRSDRGTGSHLLLSASGSGCWTCPSVNQRHTFNASGQLLTTTDHHGHQFRRVYDELGRVTELYIKPVNETERRTRKYEYHENALRPSRIVRTSVNPSASRVMSFEYDAAGRPISVVDAGFSPDPYAPEQFIAIERRIDYRYENNRLVEIDGPRKDVDDLIQFEYDNLNRLISVSRADRPTIEFGQFNPLGLPQKVNYVGASAYTLQYNADGQILRVSYPGLSASYDYDAEGRLVQSSNAHGQRTNYSYTAEGLLESLRDETGAELLLSHSSERRLIGLSALGTGGQLVRAFDYHYDNLGRLDETYVTGINMSAGRSYALNWRQNYDNRGQLTSLSGRDGASMDFEYDELGRLLSVTMPDHTETHYEYDRAGGAATVVDRRGNRTATIRDDFGRIVLQQSPDTDLVMNWYDPAGNVVRQKIGQSLLSMQWDAANRLISRTGDSDVLTVHYDPISSNVAMIANDSATEWFTYNRVGQITSHRRVVDSQEFLTSYHYDAKHNLKRKQLPDGASLHYVYDSKGASHQTLKHVNYQSADAVRIVPVLSDIDDNRSDRLTGYTAPDGSVSARRYYSDGRLKSVVAGRQLVLNYRYQDDGQISQIQENARVQNFSYERGRLAHASVRTGMYDYSYNALGSRQNESVNTPGAQHRFEFEYPPSGEGNRLLAIQNTDKVGDANSQTFSYNSMGSRTVSSAGWQYRYDERQQLTDVFQHGRRIASYAYNGFGERVKKTSYSTHGEPAITYYYYDKEVLAGEYSPAVNAFRDYVYHQGVPVALLENRSVYSIHVDHLGAPRLLMSSDGEVMWQANYHPYGSAELQVQKMSLNLRFVGQYLDDETGLHYNMMRYYDPAVGQYLTPDPLSITQGSNLYAYVDGNPIAFVDPLGLYLVAFDGTGNTPSDLTNVHMFYDYYRDGNRDYQVGVATDGPLDYYAMGGPFGIGGRSRIDDAIDQLKVHLATSSDNVIDIVGFSRGAAQAREFANEIIRRRDRGEFAQNFTIRFMGLFETVATGFAQEGQVNFCEDYELTIPDEIGHVSQAIAMNEHRIMFPLSTINPDIPNPVAPPNRVQASFIGAHSDIGGGYRPPSPDYVSGDLSDVAFVWMMEQARLAGVNMAPIQNDDRTVSAPVLHDERTEFAQYVDTDREIYQHDDEDESRPHTHASLVVGAVGLMPDREYQRDHPDYQILSQFILPDGTVDMPAYSAWLKLNYGIDIHY